MITGALPDIERMRETAKPSMWPLSSAKGHKIARRVKTADILDNLNASRLSAVTEKDMRRMNRYLTALRELRDAEA